MIAALTLQEFAGMLFLAFAIGVFAIMAIKNPQI